MASRYPARMKSSPAMTRQTVEHLLGPLRRRAARYRAGLKEAGDELLILTLETAISEEASRPDGLSIHQWLHSIMKRHLN